MKHQVWTVMYQVTTGLSCFFYILCINWLHFFYFIQDPYVLCNSEYNLCQASSDWQLCAEEAKLHSFIPCGEDIFYSTCTSLMKDKNWVPVSNAQEGTDILLGNTSRFQLNKLNSKTTSSKTDTGQRLFNIESQFWLESPPAVGVFLGVFQLLLTIIGLKPNHQCKE